MEAMGWTGEGIRAMKRFLSLGAGVQSSTLALMIAHGELEPVDAAIFADTQNEPDAVIAWLDWLEAEIQRCPYPFSVYRVTKGNLAERELAIRVSKKSGNRYIQGGIPAFVKDPAGKRAGLLGRKCTVDFKIQPIYAKVRELLGIKRVSKNQSVLAQMAIGISLDEAHRMKPSRFPYCENYWPLIDMRMTRDDCFAWMKAKGYPTPPRSACVFCPFHSDTEWVRLRDEEPHEFARAVEFEKQMHVAYAQQNALRGIPFLHTSCVPLDEVKFANVKSHVQVDMFGNECEGLCGV
jgi:hypothetical protein